MQGSRSSKIDLKSLNWEAEWDFVILTDGNGSLKWVSVCRGESGEYVGSFIELF